MEKEIGKRERGAGEWGEDKEEKERSQNVVVFARGLLDTVGHWPTHLGEARG